MHPKRLANPTAKRPKASDDETDELIEKAWADGWWCVKNRRHIKCFPADPTQLMVVASATPSDHRSAKNARSSFRKSGLNV